MAQQPQNSLNSNRSSGVLRASSVLPVRVNLPAIPASRFQSHRTPLFFMVVLIVFFIMVAGISGWFIYQHFFTDAASDSSSVNANENTNVSIVVPVVNSAPTNSFVQPLVKDDDTDNDGLLDSEEQQYGTDIAKFDTDSDGLSDRLEVEIYKTMPLDPDTDNDGFTDGEEVDALYNPNGKGELRDVNAALNNINQ